MSISVVLNFVCFQALWFSCVVGAGAYNLNWLAVASIAPIAAVIAFTKSRTADLAIAVLAVCIGMIIDNIWVSLGILSYPGYSFAPFWIGILWFGLGLTINHSMAMFRDRYIIGSLIVGAFAPVTYLTGQRFGAVVIEDLWLTPLICVTWFVVFLGLAKFALWLADADDRQLVGHPRNG